MPWLVTYSAVEPLYIMKVEKKGRATETLSDHYGHTAFPVSFSSRKDI